MFGTYLWEENLRGANIDEIVSGGTIFKRFSSEKLGPEVDLANGKMYD